MLGSCVAFALEEPKLVDLMPALLHWTLNNFGSGTSYSPCVWWVLGGYFPCE